MQGEKGQHVLIIDGNSLRSGGNINVVKEQTSNQSSLFLCDSEDTGGKTIS